ncbi:hypothetical protein Tco_1359284 [Tanacetum coccineum]
MSSSPHSTVVPSDSDNENTFSSTNILNYFPASPGNISPNSSDDFTKYLLDILLVPTVTEIRIYKQMCHFYHPHVIIALQFVPPRCLDFPRFLFLPKGDFITGKALDSFRSRFRSLMGIEMDGFSASRGRNTRASRRKDLDRACASHYEVSNLMEISVSESHVVSRNASCAGIVREPLFEERSVKMPPKRTSTSAAPAMTQDAIRQLVADSVAIALKAQAANLANTRDKTTRTLGQAELHTTTTPMITTTITTPTIATTTTTKTITTVTTITTNSRIEGKKLSELMLPPQLRTKGILKSTMEIFLCVQNAPYITPEFALASVGLATREKGHYKSQCSKTDNSTFHVSKKSLCDESLVIPMKEIWLDDKLNYVEEPVEIMDREVKQLKQSCIPIVKVLSGSGEILLAVIKRCGLELNSHVERKAHDAALDDGALLVKRCGYFFLNWSSRSHVNSGPLLELDTWNEVWKVIQNGNSKKRISIGKDGVVRVLSPVTVVEIQAIEKERKAKNILLMAIPKEHMRRFHRMDDAKEIWEAIRTRFGGNAIQKDEKAVFKQQFEADLNIQSED